MTAAPSRSPMPSATSSLLLATTPVRLSSADRRAPPAARSKSRRSNSGGGGRGIDAPTRAVPGRYQRPSRWSWRTRLVTLEKLPILEPKELLAHQHERAGWDGAFVAEPEERPVR